MLDAWRPRDSGNMLTYGTLGFLAGVITALGIGGCGGPEYPIEPPASCTTQ
jgi:hypothetical protein